MADSEVLEKDRKVLDDLLWLRYLEVESATSTNFSRESRKFKKLGTTPFTISKRMKKNEDDETFGFEISWTKPVFVSSITKDSLADQIHLEIGDFIIFVNSENVVDKSRSEIVNLLNGDEVLFLEIFRRAKLQLERVVTIESESCSFPNESNSSKETPTTRANVEKLNLTYKSSTESTRKKQLTFRKDESTCSSVDSQKSLTNKLLQNFLTVEKNFVDCLLFGTQRYIEPLKNRKDLISSREHEILFGNIECIREIMLKICYGERDNLDAVIQSYKKEFSIFRKAFESYFSVSKIADTIIVDKTHHPSFIKFIASPQVPSNQPLFHCFVQKPLDFYNDLQKHFQILSGQYKVDSLEFKEIQSLLEELQISFRDRAAKNENKVEVKPLLKTLESRLVFTKCKPFPLDVPGRTFIFAGDLTRIEKEKEFPIYALLFNDIFLFSTINRDRVLFIMEEPINLISITESFFNIRKKETEFRLLIETNPNYKDLSPTTRCTPDIIRRSPMREQSKKRSIQLRAGSEDIKKVWQNFITQSVFKLNNSFSDNNFLEPQKSNVYLNPNNQTTEASSTKIETETFRSPSKKHFNLTAINNLKQQMAIDFSESLEKLNDDSLATPDTPSFANLSINERLQNSLSFSSSLRNESCEGIFDFECDFFANDVCNEAIFCDDPFFVDES